MTHGDDVYEVQSAAVAWVTVQLTGSPTDPELLTAVDNYEVPPDRRVLYDAVIADLLALVEERGKAVVAEYGLRLARHRYGVAP